MKNLPVYRRQPTSPVLDTGARAQIRIYSPPIVETASSPIFPLCGSFVIPEEYEHKTSVSLMQAIVILIRGPYPESRQVGEGELFFPDDLIHSDGLIYGHFSLDLFKHFNLIREPARYWVSASLFDLVSSVVSVEVI